MFPIDYEIQIYIHREMYLSKLCIKCIVFVFWQWKCTNELFPSFDFPLTLKSTLSTLHWPCTRSGTGFYWSWRYDLDKVSCCYITTASIVKHSRFRQMIAICIVSLLVSLRIRINIKTNKQKFKETLFSINKKISFSFSQRTFSYTRIRYSRYTSTF